VIEHLPAELRDRFTEMREVDLSVQSEWFEKMPMVADNMLEERLSHTSAVKGKEEPCQKLAGSSVFLLKTVTISKKKPSSM